VWNLGVVARDAVTKDQEVWDGVQPQPAQGCHRREPLSSECGTHKGSCVRLIACVSLNSRLESNKEEEEEDIRQPRPDSGHGFQVKVLETLNVVPSSLGSGSEEGLYFRLIDFCITQL